MTKPHSVWKKPRTRMGSLAISEGYRGKWVNDTDEEIEDALEEGYIFVNKTTSPHAKLRGRPAANRAEDGVEPFRYRGMVGMQAPEEIAQSKEAYLEDETKRRTNARIVQSVASQTAAKSDIALAGGYIN